MTDLQKELAFIALAWDSGHPCIVLLGAKNHTYAPLMLNRRGKFPGGSGQDRTIICSLMIIKTGA